MSGSGGEREVGSGKERFAGVWGGGRRSMPVVRGGWAGLAVPDRVGLGGGRGLAGRRGF